MRRLALALLVVLPVLPAGDARAQPAAAAADEPITPIRPAIVADPAQAALGAVLFADPGLSGDGRESCQSCHDLRTNGASARAHDLSPDGRPIPTNTSTVFNAALSFRLDWKGDIRTLQEQAAIAITSPEFMAADPKLVVQRLRSDPAIRQRFRRAFGHDPDWPSLLDALAAFEDTLVTPGSRFDRWLEGDNGAITADERAGYELFKSIGCAACHQGVNVGGNLYESVGVFGRWPGGGRKLRVPSLRNVSTTPPFFDDGSAATLGDAVHRMASHQLGLDLDDAQVALIVGFLGTLTGNYRGHPVTAAR